MQFKCLIYFLRVPPKAINRTEEDTGTSPIVQELMFCLWIKLCSVIKSLHYDNWKLRKMPLLCGHVRDIQMQQIMMYITLYHLAHISYSNTPHCTIYPCGYTWSVFLTWGLLVASELPKISEVWWRSLSG